MLKPERSLGKVTSSASDETYHGVSTYLYPFEVYSEIARDTVW